MFFVFNITKSEAISLSDDENCGNSIRLGVGVNPGQGPILHG